MSYQIYSIVAEGQRGARRQRNKGGGRNVGRIAQNPDTIGIRGFPRVWEVVGSLGSSEMYAGSPWMKRTFAVSKPAGAETGAAGAAAARAMAVGSPFRRAVGAEANGAAQALSMEHGAR